MKKRREAAAIALALALVLCLGWVIGWLLMPQRSSYGSTWEAYRQEERDSLDLLFFGSSLVYCDVIPACIWAESGLRSYVMAGPEQTMPLTYYYVREACRTQSPRTVMVELTGMFYQKYQNYTKANVGYMPLGANRLAATFAGAEPAERMGLLFPLLSYHSRWTEVTGSDVRSHLQPRPDVLAGYTFLTTACTAPTPAERTEFTSQSETYAENLRWLEKLRDFCAEEGIELRLFLAPAAASVPAAERSVLAQDVQALGLTLTDFGEVLPELGIDDASDWYDNLHFNVKGAEKFSRWLGAWLRDSCGLQPAADGTELWQTRLDALTQRREQEGA